MVEKKKIGVIGIQGAVSEHVSLMQKTLKTTDIPGEVFPIKYKDQIDDIDALIIPGGESSTISKILTKSGANEIICKQIKDNNLPVMGTCAGCVILATNLVGDNIDIVPLKAIDMDVKRNAFGRQKESFEKSININNFDKPYSAVFIRAPIIEKVWGNCEVLAKVDEKIVMVRQKNLFALSFHPELTDDIRVHKYFLEMI
jgi:5'-phosphate synthase pdxT subunit